MTRTAHVRLETTGNSHHSHQVIAGFTRLAERGEIELQVDWSRPGSSRLPASSWVLAEIDGRRVAYDTDDGDVLEPEIVDPFVDAVEVLWRRSMPITPRVHYRTVHKHRPLGLNYHATLRAPYFWSAAVRSNRGARRLGALALATRDHADRIRPPRPGDDDGTILFQTRLWDPIQPEAEMSAQRLWAIDQRARINEQRIELVRALRDQFGDRLKGGLAPSPLVERLAPDLVLPRGASSPCAFLRAAGHARVCVTSRGLWDSNGWKLAEFLGLGRAVVAERPAHLVPGLEEGRDFAGFGSVAEAVSAVRVLDEDPAARAAMQRAARRHFEAHIEPAAMVRRTIDALAPEPVAATTAG